MHVVDNIFSKSLVIFCLIFFALSGAGNAAEKKAKTEPKLSFDRASAGRSLINPHEQINDEGEILWSKCLICHVKMPDMDNLASPSNQELRFKEDYSKNCYICHVVSKHPGSRGVGVQMSGFVAPSHLTELSRTTYLNMRLEKKEIPVLIPLEPGTGKIFCGTCHNPHERGLLYGRPDWGADQDVRLRSEGVDVCQYCHRK